MYQKHFNNIEDLYAYKRDYFKLIGYTPHDGQNKLHFNEKKTAKFFTAACGRRWGKTVGTARGEACVAMSLPDMQVGLVGLTHEKSELLFKEVWQTFVIDQPGSIASKSWRDRYIETTWGSICRGRSADSPDSLVGDAFDLLIIDEVAKMSKKTWDMHLSSTLLDRKGSAYFISTPQGYNWFYDLFRLGDEDPEWANITAPSWENNIAFPNGINEPELQERMRNMPVELWEQEIGAKFTSFEGKVYPFRRELDVDESVRYNPNLPTYCAIDFGFRMPAVIWIQLDERPNYEDDVMETHINIIDEIIHERDIKTDELISRVKSKPYKVWSYYGDPAGEGVQGQTGMGDIEMFRHRGIDVLYRTDKLSRSISQSVAHTRGFFENAKGTRRVHVSPKCAGIIYDFENYRFPEHKEGRPLKAEPIKDGYVDHGCDAFRAFINNKFPIRDNKLIRSPRW